jgi:hypothetical protein
MRWSNGVAALILSSWISLCSGQAHATWVIVSASPNTDEVVLYNDERIVKLPGGLVSVWLIYTGGNEKKIAARKKVGLPTVGYEDYSNSANKMLYDCAKKQIAVASINDYTENRTVLEETNIDVPELQFETVAEGSISEKVLTAVCVNTQP